MNYFREDPELLTKLKIYLKTKGITNPEIILINNLDGKGIFIGKFLCKECVSCKSGESCDLKSLPDQKELDSKNETIFTKEAIDEKKKEEDIFLQKLKKYLKTDCFN